MTTRTIPSPIEIIADSSLCAAAEAGDAVIAFDAGLTLVLFADAGGRALIGGSDASPALRQVRSAARTLAATGSARVQLRRSSRAGTALVEAHLVLRPADETRPAFALMTVAKLGQPLDDASLLEATGLTSEAVAVFADAKPIEATDAFSSQTMPDLIGPVSGFQASRQATASIELDAFTLTLFRAPFARTIVKVDARRTAAVELPAPAPAPTEANAPPSPGEPAASAPAGFASFSVKRPKLGEMRPGMSMGALLQRWHQRGPETGTADGSEGDASEEIWEDRANAPESARNEEPAQAAPVAQQDEAPRKSRTRSNWGSPPAEAANAVADTADVDALSPNERQDVSTPLSERGDAEAEPVIVEDVADDSHRAEPTSPTETMETLSDEADADLADTSVPDAVEAASLDHDATDDSSYVSEALAVDEPTAITLRAPPAFVPRFDIAPVRFVWQIDREGAFRFLSPDFATAVGPHAADVVGRSFATVARVFGFDETREIARLLERRDTWSGRTIFWPVEGSDRKVPVDLAALPVYGRDRSFDGFRGFGIVRLNESVADDESLGLHLTQGPAPTRDVSQVDIAEADETPEPEPRREKPFLRRFEAESFGRRAEPPATAAEPEPVPVPETAETQPDQTQKVIRLEERRRPREGALSSAEEAAFRAIGAKLGHKAEAESPGALRFEDPAAPASPGEDEAAKAELPPEAESPAAPNTDGAVSPPPAPSGTLSGTMLPEDDKIEPALEALSEKLARAEAEADQRLAERRQRLAGSPAGTVSDATLVPAIGEQPVEAAMPDDATDAGVTDAVEDRPDAPDETAEQAIPIDHPTSAGQATTPAEDIVAAERSQILADESTAGIAEAPRAEDRDEDFGEVEDLDTDNLDDETPIDTAVFERLFGSLPLAVLVQVREHTVYTNAEFGALTGHADAAAVEAAGGLDQLVLDRQGEGTLALQRADGEIVDVHAHMQRIAEGGRSALLMSFQRVADEESLAGPALEDLRQEVEELQAVLDTATDGVVLLDINGNIRAMNGSAHALFGIGTDEAFGRHLSSLFAHESQKATVDYLEMLRDDGIGGILNDGREVIGRVSQGGFIPLFITIGRLSGERGWCVVIRDIAHWKRIEEDLVNARRQAEAASLHKSRFLANISHELRTPLNAIIGFADVMSSECFGPIGNERYLEYLGDIKRSGHHVLDLVNDLLDISKIEAGKIDLSFEAVALNEVISEAVSLMQPQANRERVIVRSNLPSSVPPVVADRRTMRQIALNLLANAIRFTPAGGQIIASTTYSAEGDVLLRFRDSGIGMTEREIELALTPFQQVHAPSANRGEGTGLGLPLTKAMVEANRAHFSIQSTPGEGTLVEIVFPAPRVLAD